MNVAIVGGTSQVATELCMLLRERGHEVHPTVRSRVGASFYDYHDIDYRVVDVTDADEAREALQDADVVAIAAFARQYSREFAPRQARRTNERIIRGSVEAAPSDSIVVYFSSIAAFGRKVGFSNWDSYGREKRHAENALSEALDTYGKEGHAFRMGPVYGVNQDKAAQLRRQIERNRGRDGDLTVDVSADKRSNALHAVTLLDAIETVAERSFDRREFTLVNEPPWTWQEMLEYYAPEGTTIKFMPSDGGPSGSKVVRFAKELVESYERPLRGASVYLPARLNQRLFHEYVKRQVASEVKELSSTSRLSLSQFEEEPAPKARIEGLRRTRELLQLEEDVAAAFSDEL